jgi:hypothetical protein
MSAEFLEGEGQPVPPLQPRLPSPSADSPTDDRLPRPPSGAAADMTANEQPLDPGFGLREDPVSNSTPHIVGDCAADNGAGGDFDPDAFVAFGNLDAEPSLRLGSRTGPWPLRSSSTLRRKRRRAGRRFWDGLPTRRSRPQRAAIGSRSTASSSLPQLPTWPPLWAGRRGRRPPCESRYVKTFASSPSPVPDTSSPPSPYG